MIRRDFLTTHASSSSGMRNEDTDVSAQIAHDFREAWLASVYVYRMGHPLRADHTASRLSTT